MTPTQVLKADQTNCCVDPLTLHKLMFLYEVDLLKLQLSSSASSLCDSPLCAAPFLLSFCPSHLRTSWFRLFTFLNSSFSCLSCLSLAYLALEPSSYSHPGSQSLSKGIFPSQPACPVLLCSAASSLSSSVKEGGFSPQCGSDSCTLTLIWSPSLLLCM